MYLLRFFMIGTVFFLSGIHSWGALVTFDLLNDSSLYTLLDDQASATVTNQGIIVTLTASDGVLNRTVDGFGINGSDTGDDTDALNKNQFIDLVFAQDLTFSNLDVSS